MVADTIGLEVDQLADAVPVALVALDARRRIVAANAEAEALLGQSRRALSGRALSEIVFHDTPIFELIDKAETLHGDMTAHGVPMSGPHLPSGQVHDIRIRQDSNAGFLIAFSRSLGREATETTPGVAAFGRILGHEVKNPLAGISGAAQLLLRHDNKDQAELLNLILDETRRIERLVTRLSAFELFSAPRLKSVNVHALLDRVLAAEEAAFDERVRYHRLYDPSLPDILGDADHLHEAFQNIMRNASEAACSAEGGSMVTVRTSYEAGFGIMLKSSPRARRRALRVTVEDTGPGIPVERQSAIFEMFQSTKSGGRGLGLSVVGEIVSAHGGQMKMESHPGRTRFSVYLPLAEETSDD